MITDSYGNKAVITTYKDPVSGEIRKANIPYNNRGLPIFDDIAKHTTTIKKPKGWQSMKPKSVAQAEMRNATRDLREYLKKYPKEKNKFTTEQLSDIRKGNHKIEGYTWHHNADSNNMQLVPEDIHRAVKHIGEATLKEGR